jgi:hypothetical protein
MFGFLRRRRRRSSSLQRPLRRTDGVITTETEDEVLVYDELRHHIHHLNPTTSLVWRLCDGTRTIDRIAQESGIEREPVTLALQKLAQAHLLEGDTSPWGGDQQSRRSFLRKAGMASIPAIVSVTAPSAMAAASLLCKDKDAPCNFDSECCGNLVCFPDSGGLHGWCGI